MYSLDAMPGNTDLILVTAKSCPVEPTAKECLSYQQLQEPRESLSYKRLTSGFGSSQRLFDEISSMIDRLEERSTNGETGQKNINIWCPPCSHMLMTAETIAAHFSRGTEERIFTINVHPRMLAGCCKNVPVRTLVQKMQAIKQMIDDPDLIDDQDAFDARCLYNYGDLDHHIYHMEGMTEEEHQRNENQIPSVEDIIDTSDLCARLIGDCFGIILAEADVLTSEWARCSSRFEPYSRPFQPNQYFSLIRDGHMWNPKVGFGGGFELKYEIWFMGTWV
jgi:hypothetical protein